MSLSPVCVSKQPMRDLNAAATNVDVFHLLDVVLQKWLWGSDLREGCEAGSRAAGIGGESVKPTLFFSMSI